jgi:hypothetical protein
VCLPTRLLAAGGEKIAILFFSNIHPPRLKIFTPFDFYRSHLTSRLIQNICENTKIIMIYLKYIR